MPESIVSPAGHAGAGAEDLERRLFQRRRHLHGDRLGRHALAGEAIALAHERRRRAGPRRRSWAGGTVPATNFTRHEVQRPRPPQVAVMSMPAAWAAARMLVPAGSDSSRRGSARRGSVRMVSATAMRRHCNGVSATISNSTRASPSLSTAARASAGSRRSAATPPWTSASRTVAARGRSTSARSARGGVGVSFG